MAATRRPRQETAVDFILIGDKAAGRGRGVADSHNGSPRGRCFFLKTLDRSDWKNPSIEQGDLERNQAAEEPSGKALAYTAVRRSFLSVKEA